MATLKEIFQIIKHQIRMFFRTRDWKTFCLFIVFATMLWFGHALYSTRERVLEIPINYTGIPEEVIFDEELPEYLYIKVRDQGKRLRTYSKVLTTPLTIDLSKQITEKEGCISISSEQIRPTLTDHLQGTAKVQKVTPELIQRNYVKESSKIVPVAFNGEIVPQQLYQFTTPPTISPMYVRIYGSPLTLNEIDTIRTTYYTRSGVRDTLETDLYLELPSRVRAAKETVHLTAITEAYTEKVLRLPILTKGVPEGLKLITFPSEVQLSVRVGVRHFNDVKSDHFQAICHFPKKEVNKLPVEIRHTSTVVSHIRVTPSEVEYIIEKQ